MDLKAHRSRAVALACAAASAALIGALGQTMQRGPAEQPARAAHYAVLELPHFDRMEAAAGRTRVQPQHRDALSAARHAPARGLPSLPRQPGLQGSRHALLRLSRRPASRPVRRPLRSSAITSADGAWARSQCARIPRAFRCSARTPPWNARRATRAPPSRSLPGFRPRASRCHQQDFQNTRTINHVAAGFPVTCDACHNVDTWLRVGSFDHARFTGFALSGVHARLDCVSCHAGNRFKGTPAACIGCHQAEFAATKDPPHAAAGFPTDCSLCHTSDTWLNAKFDHSLSKFPLTGAHAATQCAQCHVNNQFAGTPTQCSACHLDAFQKTTNPNHASAGIPHRLLGLPLHNLMAGRRIRPLENQVPPDRGPHCRLPARNATPTASSQR